MSSPGMYTNRAAAYRMLAAENFAQAQHASTPQLRRWFLEIANSYARMAAHAERSAADTAQRPKSR